MLAWAENGCGGGFCLRWHTTNALLSGAAGSRPDWTPVWRLLRLWPSSTLPLSPEPLAPKT